MARSVKAISVTSIEQFRQFYLGEKDHIGTPQELLVASRPTTGVVDAVKSEIRKLKRKSQNKK